MTQTIIRQKTEFLKKNGYVIFKRSIEHNLIDRFTQDFENLLQQNRPLKVNLAGKITSFQDIVLDTEREKHIRYGRFINNSFDKAIELNSNDDFALCYRGITLNDLGRYQEAIEYLDRALELNYSNYYTWYNRGFAFFEIEQYQQAINCYEKAIDINYSCYEAWYSKGLAINKLCDRALLQKLNSDERFASLKKQELDCYDRAIKIKPNDCCSWYRLGKTFFELKQYQQAIASFDKVIELNPKYHQAWHKKSISLLQQGKYQEAFQAEKQAIKIRVTNFSVIKKLLNQSV